MTRAIAPRPQLLTYPDSLGGDLRTLGDLLEGPLDGVFHGVHILPPFPSSGDRGFAPLTHDVIDPRFGGWEDIRRIAATKENLMPAVLEAAELRCTVGEIMAAMADVFGRYEGAARW